MRDSEEAIEAAGVGEFEGNEIAADMSDRMLYMYGPDAGALFLRRRRGTHRTDSPLIDRHAPEPIESSRP